MQPTPTEQEIEDALKSAAGAIGESQVRREYHRGHKRPNRAQQLEETLERLCDAAPRIRRLRGMVLAHPISDEHDRLLRMAMKNLQAERRKIRKMLK